MAAWSFQLYSARNFTPWDDVCRQLARLGYASVEGFGAVYDDPATTRAMLDRHGLTMPTGHFSLDGLENDAGRTFDIARALGVRTIYCPHVAADQRPADAPGWQEFGRRLAAIGAKARAAGLAFGWHNHDFEFRPLADGTIPMQHLLDAAPEIEWEIDVAWVIRGGADPLDWIGRHGRRITAAHVKDIAPAGENADEDGWADVGHGVVNWRALLAALAAGTGATTLVVEHDKPSDFVRFAARSIAALDAMGA